jgi:tetratricopeptide (TPR) repeat protein
MTVTRRLDAWVFTVAVLMATVAACPAAKPASPAGALGRIDFPVSGPALARQHFLRGMMAMHSFWYDEARDEFRAATAAAPAFAMGYWGEALTYYRPVWRHEDLAASRAVMAKLPPTLEASPRERAFLDAARVLFGDGDRKRRWRAYAQALERLHQRFPEDDEAATLYAVALLGVAYIARYDEGQDPGFRELARAAALGLDVLAHNPDHPGAAHYVIHAFDDPEHAVLALPAAHRYSRIAPEANHAQHMPSHIFVQLGMWPEAARSNEAAWEASGAWVRRKQLDGTHHDFHSLSWLQAVYLEQGQRRKAGEVLGRARAVLATAREQRAWIRVAYAQLAADYLIETDDWARFDDVLAPLAGAGPASAEPDAPPLAPSGPTCHPVATGEAQSARVEAATLAWLRGLAALARKDADAAVHAADALAEVAATRTSDSLRFRVLEANAHNGWRAIELELRARAAALRGDQDAALAQLQAAIAIEERTPSPGPVIGVTARERLGDLWLAAGRPADALREYRRTLELHPRRGRALFGAASAASALDDPSAASLWSELGRVWAHADPDQPGIAELHRALAARP